MHTGGKQAAAFTCAKLQQLVACLAADATLVQPFEQSSDPLVDLPAQYSQRSVFRKWCVRKLFWPGHTAQSHIFQLPLIDRRRGGCCRLFVNSRQRSNHRLRVTWWPFKYAPISLDQG